MDQHAQVTGLHFILTDLNIKSVFYVLGVDSKQYEANGNNMITRNRNTKVLKISQHLTMLNVLLFKKIKAKSRSCTNTSEGWKAS